jgi:hypothetical protein
MEAFESGYARKGTGAIYWCGFGDGEIPDSVHALLDKARANSRTAIYIPTAGFGDLRFAFP